MDYFIILHGARLRQMAIKYNCESLLNTCDCRWYLCWCQVEVIYLFAYIIAPVHYLANISIIKLPNQLSKIIKDTLEIATIHTEAILAVFNIEHRVLQPQLKFACKWDDRSVASGLIIWILFISFSHLSWNFWFTLDKWVSIWLSSKSDTP